MAEITIPSRLRGGIVVEVGWGFTGLSPHPVGLLADHPPPAGEGLIYRSLISDAVRLTHATNEGLRTGIVLLPEWPKGAGTPEWPYGEIFVAPVSRIGHNSGGTAALGRAILSGIQDRADWLSSFPSAQGSWQGSAAKSISARGWK